MEFAKHTFFCPDPEVGKLSSDESHHAIKVMRLNLNDRINLLDGNGGKYLAEVTGTDKKGLEFNILNSEIIQRKGTSIHLIIAPTKSIDRFSFLIEKITELGIAEITPIYTANSERRKLNIDKIQKGLIASIKQSGNLFLPKLNEPVSITDKEFNLTGTSFVAHCKEDHDKKPLKDFQPFTGNVSILVGPEGDFTTEEINLVKQKGAQAVDLSDQILRTETAGIIACYTVQLLS